MKVKVKVASYEILNVGKQEKKIASSSNQMLTVASQ